MTAAAGVSLFHVTHGMALAFRTGNKKFAVAIGAFVHFQMEFVAEKGIGSKGNILNCMAFGAILLDGEGSIPIVAGTARRPLLHLAHGNMRVAWRRLEKLVVAIATTIHAEMEVVTENDGAELGDLNRYFLDQMAFDALIKTECLGFVVTDTAGFPLLHLGHCHRRRICCYGKYGFMTNGAVAAQLFQVKIVIKNYLAAFSVLKVTI